MDGSITAAAVHGAMRAHTRCMAGVVVCTRTATKPSMARRPLAVSGTGPANASASGGHVKKRCMSVLWTYATSGGQESTHKGWEASGKYQPLQE